jgi:hypothetical protein
MQSKVEIYKNLFTKKNKQTILEEVTKKIREQQWDEILYEICNVKENNILINYNYFKYFGTSETYETIIQLLIRNIDKILEQYDNYNVYLNMQLLSISQLERHNKFFFNISQIIMDKYPKNYLNKCYVYNAPFVGSQFINIIRLFNSKETIDKIELVK